MTACTCDPGPEGQHRSYCGQTADGIMKSIEQALCEGDMPGAAALIRWLALVDPRSAEVIMLAALKGEL